MTKLQKAFLSQPSTLRGIEPSDRDKLIVSMRKVGDTWNVTSLFKEDIWTIYGAPTNVPRANTFLHFERVPASFRAIVKETMYRYLRHGLEGRKKPGYSALATYLKGVVSFTHYLTGVGIRTLKDVTPFVCANYVQALKSGQISRVAKLAPSTVEMRLGSIEALFELSQHTHSPIPEHPWQDSSAHHISGEGAARRLEGRKTPLIPYQDFSTLFQTAWRIVEEADTVLTLRDEMEKIQEGCTALTREGVNHRKRQALERLGWTHGLFALNTRIILVRTACYVVLASLTGCRNHELAYVRNDSYYSTVGRDGETYWWMRSISTKTDEGKTEWMVPEAGVRALRVMERWACPYQALLQEEIQRLRKVDGNDPRITEAEEHVGALFLGLDRRQYSKVRTLTVTRWNATLAEFAAHCGIASVSTHQFRRTFANYAARSQFGDLRYLKEHFKHWSMDMTLGYALNEDQEMALFLEIQDELEDMKEATVSEWLSPATPLAGGYGSNLVKWRSQNENVVMFKSRSAMIRSIAESTAIRSNGHAWCTSDNHECSGNDTEQLRCGDGCENGVVGERHRDIYDGLYGALTSLSSCEDIGRGGAARVERDIARCRRILIGIGHDPVEPSA